MHNYVFKRIILFTRQHRANQHINETLERVISYLRSWKIELFIVADSALTINLQVQTLPATFVSTRHDLMIVIGGDGSLLSAAQLAITLDIPVIGINRGRLGFLTDISPIDIESPLHAVLTGNYYAEQRFLLTATFTTNTDKCAKKSNQSFGIALNDIVLNRGIDTHLVAFDIYINQQFVSHYCADGLIIATPTGSTAYALSAGGPIMHPELNAIAIVPMFSHSLSSRPLVITGDAHIELHISEHNENDLILSLDGHDNHHIQCGQRVSISKHSTHLKLLHPKDHHYYETLRLKLGWGLPMAHHG